MKTKPYVSPTLEILEMSMESLLCASGDKEIDFGSMGSESIEDSGNTINWGF